MRQANVLIVDENPTFRVELRTQLVGIGHRVVGEAENAQQALTLARTLRPDVVLLDVSPTTPSALDVAQTLFNERLSAVILLSATDDTTLLEKLEETTVMGFLSKPLRPIDLRVLVPLAMARFQERAALEEEIKSLNERMEARKLVGRAKAILMERHNLSERDAFKRIQSQSIALGKQAHEIAQAIITASEIALGAGSGSGGGAGTLPLPNSPESRSASVRPVRGEKSSLDAVQP